VAIGDKGFRGKTHCGTTEVVTPNRPKKNATAYKKRKAKARFRRRAAIEPRIGHLKSDFRLGRNFLKGQVMKLSKGKANPALAGEILEKKLS
jgi:IS5 family transposase